MASALTGRYYAQRKLLVVSGGMFTLTARGVTAGQRAQVLYRFRLRTHDGWKTIAPGVMAATIRCSRPA